MTTASSAGDKPWPQWRIRLATSVGHLEPKLSIPFAALNLIYWLPFFWLPIASSARSWVLYVWMFVIAVQYLLFYSATQHARLETTCPRCLNDHSLLDPQAQVEKHHEVLRRRHSARARRAETIVLVGYVTAILISIGIRQLHGGFKVALQIFCSLLLISATTQDLYSANQRRIHTWLRPWCPRCHPRRDDDDEEVIPQPTPDPGEPVHPPQHD